MESRRGNGKVQYQGKGQLLKRCLTFMLAVMVTITSIPLNMAWADELPYSERPGEDEIILDDSVEDGDLSDIDLDISHTISKKGDKAVVTVSAVPSESGQENGVTKVTKVEIHQNGKLKKGKRSEDKWEFTVKENGVYSFVIYYNSKDGEDMMVASPSEVEKIEPTTEAEPQKPGGNAGGAGGSGTVLPEETTEQEATTPETEEETTGETTVDNNTEEDKKNDGTVEGDANPDIPNESEQKPSDNTDSDGKEEGKGDTTGNQGGTDSAEQGGSSDNSTSGSDNNTSTDKENSNSSNSSDNNSDTSSNDNSDTGSSNDSGSSSTDNSGTDSSSSNNSGSSDSGSSGSSDSSDSGSSDSGSSNSGSSDNSGSDDGSDSSGTSIALNVIDFFFPVIEAQAGDFTVKKAVIVEYEITNLFPEGNPEDVDVDIFDEITEEGAMITLLVEPSEIGLEKGVREITDIALIDFEAEDEPEIIDSGEIHIATDSEVEAEILEEEEEIEEASPSDATHDTAKSSSAKHAEYQTSESDEGEYRFFVKENGTYTFTIRYGRAADLDFEDSTELVETQFSIPYELDSIDPKVQFIGVEDVTIRRGEDFDLLQGVQAHGLARTNLTVKVESDDGFNPNQIGKYEINYAAMVNEMEPVGYYSRNVEVKSSDILINEINFPDESFRNYIKKYDLNSDDCLSIDEINAVTKIEIQAGETYNDGLYIEYKSLKGIEYFTQLRLLTLEDTHVTELDLSQNLLLEELREHTYALRTLDLSNNQELKTLSIFDDNLESIQVNNNPKLKVVEIHSIKLKELDISGSPLIQTFSCAGLEQATYPDGSLRPYEKFPLTTLKLHPEVKPNQFFCNDTKLKELYLNTELLTQFVASNCELEKLILTPNGNRFFNKFRIGGNRLPSLNLEEIIRMRNFVPEEQKVSAYYTQEEGRDLWSVDMKQLIEEKDVDRVEFIDTENADHYNPQKGILVLDEIPDDNIIAYDYDVKAPGYDDYRLHVLLKLKLVKIKTDNIIYVTKEQAMDESYIKQMLNESGTYESEDGSIYAIEKGNYRYHFNRNDGIITSVGVSAMMDNGWETPILATVKVAIWPAIHGTDVVMYENEEYKREQLNIKVSGADDGSYSMVIDDKAVNADKAGTYQVKVCVTLENGKIMEKYLYVQVVGRTRFKEISDLHIRKDSTLTKEQLLANIVAVYDKPEEIPEEPWTEANKVNNGQAAITTAVEVRSVDEVNTDTVQKTKINLSASGMIRGREMTGKADAERNIYIHGIPVIVAYDNGIHTHQSTDDRVLEQIVRTGKGSLEREAASAYVEYVQPDGSIKKVVINPDKITYTVNQYVPLTAGEYLVHAKVDDSSVLTLAQAPELTFAEGEKEAKVVVADKMYTVNFETGENGSLENPADSMTVVTHGSKVVAPELVLKEGYIFSGWLDEEGNPVASVSDITITSDCTFTAEIKLKEFTVRFIGKNGNVISTQIVKYGADANPPTDHADVKDGRFIGWDVSYTGITKDTDIHAKYRSNSGDSGGSGGSGGGGPSGGDRYVPSGPGSTTTSIDFDVPKSPFDNLVTIGTNPVPTGNMDIPVFTGLPKTGDVSVGSKANIGYQATLIDGTRALSDDEPLVGNQNGGFVHVFEEHADWRKCILHIILLIISALEGIFYFFKRRKDKRLLEKLRKELEEEDK